MHGPSRLTAVVVSVLAVLGLPVLTNIATNALPPALSPFLGWAWLGLVLIGVPIVVADIGARQSAKVRPEPPALPPTSIDALCGPPGAPGRNITSSFIDAQLHRFGALIPFAGRDEELKWLNDGESAPYALVSGDIGAGKSALLVRWLIEVIARESPPHTIFTPITTSLGATQEHGVLHALWYRLAKVHAVAYDRLATADEAAGHVFELLSRPAPEGTTVLVVVDALDEADGWEPGPRHFPRRPGKGVRVVFSARHTRSRPTPHDWITALGLGPGECVSLVIGVLGADAVRDLVRQVLGTSDETAVATRLYELTEGEPVSTALYLQELRETRGADLSRWPGDRRTTTAGLPGYLRRWLDERQQWWQREDDQLAHDAEHVLNLLAFAKGPLEHRHLLVLARHSGLELDGHRVRAILTMVDRFVLPGLEPHSTVLGHQLIALRLRERVAELDEQDRFAQPYVSWAVDVLQALSDGQVAPDEVPVYLVRHLSAHLQPNDAGVAGPVPVPIARLCDLLRRPWRRAQEHGSDHLDGYQRDISRVASHVRAVNAAAVHAGDPPPHLPEQVLCAAAKFADRGTITRGLTPRLAGQLLRHGLWRPARALDYVSKLPNQWVVSAGIVALAPFLPPEHLPRLRDLLREKLTGYYPEAVARATAALAVRLVDLGDAEAALAEADWDCGSREGRSFVAIWTLGELIPRLAPPLGAEALRRAFALVTSDRSGVVPAVARLVRCVPREQAEALWGNGCCETLMQRLVPSHYRFTGHPFLSSWDGERLRLDYDAFVAVCPWLDEELVVATLDEVLDDAECREWLEHFGLLPGLNYEGLMSVVPSGHAEHVIGQLRGNVRDHALKVCLLQLLPVVPARRRADLVAELFDDPAALPELDLNELDAVAPAVGRAGVANRVIDAVEARALTRQARWLEALAPWLSPDLVERALACTAPDEQGPLLAQLATFGAAETARTLDLAHGDGEDHLPGELRSLLRRTLSDFDDGPFLEPGGFRLHGTTNYTVPWWEEGTYLGVPWRWATGLGPFRRPGCHGGPPDPAARHRIADAFEIASAIEVDDLPWLRAVVSAEPEPWAALTLLAAGTHLRDDDAREEIVEEITRRVRELSRQPALPERTPGEGVPADAPWLFRLADQWTPFFVRMLAPQVVPRIAPLLFEGGYLDGVRRTHGWWMEEAHERIDDWAHDVQTLTPILDAGQLDRLAGMADEVRSATARDWFWTGVVVGYATSAQWPKAFTALGRVHGGAQTTEARLAAFTEVGALVPAELLPEWLRQVHQRVRSHTDRGQLLHHVLRNRWPELTNDQCWQVLDHWLTEAPYRDRIGLLADSLHYAHAISRLAGRSEVARVLTLMNIDPLDRPNVSGS